MKEKIEEPKTRENIKDIFESFIEDVKDNKAFDDKSHRFIYMAAFVRGVSWALKKVPIKDDERKSIMKDCLLTIARNTKKFKEDKDGEN